MRGLTLRSKVSLWYTLAMVLITCSSVIILVALGTTLIQARQRTDLINFVNDMAANAKEDENGTITFNTSYITSGNSIMLVLYDKNHLLIRGFNPPGMPSNINIPPNSVTIAQNTKTKERWYVYEIETEIEKSKYYLRGVTGVPMLINDAYVYPIISSALIILPLIILIAVLGGSAITGNAFSYFAKLSNLANNIQDSSDLSQRIGINSNDEFGMLATSFNSLFERLQKAFEREKQFTDDASHELRTPITVILSECEYASDLDDIEEMRESMQVVHKQAKKMSTLINQLLTLSRTGDLTKVLHMEEFDYGELMTMVMEELEIQAVQRDIQLIKNIDKNIYVTGDQSMLTRMLVNLVTNAIKYGRDGGWVKVSITRRDNCVVGMVSDNGIGIKKENLTKIFDRFYREDPARNDTGGSMGLGLSMVKWITEVHKGKITVESTPGEGTVFRSELPIITEKGE